MIKHFAFYGTALLLLLLSSCKKDTPVTGPVVPMETDPTLGYTLGNLPAEEGLWLPPAGETWEYVDAYTDEFDYEGKGAAFDAKWNDTYHNAWRGPGQTEWTSANSAVTGGQLILKATRKPGTTDRVHCGVITSNEPIIFPIYTEISGKVANQVLSSNFWFLSEDDKREIDVVEIYGGDRADQTWFAANPSTNYHVFERNPNTNAIINDFNDQHHHNLPDGGPWRDDFHRYGMYWKDAWTIDFYYNGKLVHELRREGITDPEGLGLDREQFMIIDLEDHAWRSDMGIVATDEELANENKNKYFIDYVRTLQPTDDYDGGLIANGSFDQTDLNGWYWRGNVSVSSDAATNNGEVVSLRLAPSASILQKVAVEKNTDYALSWNAVSEGSRATVSIDDATQTEVSATRSWANHTLLFNSGEEDEIYVTVRTSGAGGMLFDNFYLERQ